MQAATVFQQILDHAQQNKNDSTRRVTPVVGQVIPQGDINILTLDKLPKAVKSVPAPVNGQLAPGTTQGSRHCIALKDIKHVDFYVYPDPNPLEGPVLMFNKQVTIEHPEHGNQVWPAGTIVAIGYQRRYAEELRRVQD
jgi:hypothetical protein